MLKYVFLIFTILLHVIVYVNYSVRVIIIIMDSSYVSQKTVKSVCVKVMVKEAFKSTLKLQNRCVSFQQ